MTFDAWIIEEIEKRGWTQNELARRAGVGSSSLSQVMTGLRKPGAEFCRQIARALKLPQLVVFQRAGLITDLTEVDDGISLSELWSALRRMTPAQRREVLAYARGEASAEAQCEGGSAPEPTAQIPSATAAEPR